MLSKIQSFDVTTCTSKADYFTRGNRLYSNQTTSALPSLSDPKLSFSPEHIGYPDQGYKSDRIISHFRNEINTNICKEHIINLSTIYK